MSQTTVLRRRRNRTPAERFWAKVQKTDGCWLWVGAVADRGYGSFWLEGRPVPAHRFAYEITTAPIPDGLVIDHLCKVHNCVRPGHLEPVTQSVNIIRGIGATTHCRRGHQRTLGNTAVKSTGDIYCRECRSIARRKTVA